MLVAVPVFLIASNYSLCREILHMCCYYPQSNPENTVGVLTMAGKGVRVLVTPTSDLGKILACMHGKNLGLFPSKFSCNFDSVASF